MLPEETKRLLAREEGVDVEFKETITKALTDTMVAMANASGGVILVGVRDSEDESGRQIGEVVGIPISDQNKLNIVHKAQSVFDKLFPNVESQIDAEGRPIYLVRVPEGSRKPYCTSGGRYLIRAEGNNTAITPQMMEDLILERVTAVLERPGQIAQSSLELFHADFSRFVRRFSDEWLLERDSQPLTTDDARYMLEEAFHRLLDFKSQVVAVEGTTFPEMLGEALKGMKALIQHRLYMDGGKSWQQFWDGADQVLQLLESAVAELDRVLNSANDEGES